MKNPEKTGWIVAIIKGVLCVGWGIFCIFALRDMLGDTFSYRSAFAITAGILSFEKLFELTDWMLP